MKIVFMGTPDFAAVSLQALIDAGHEILGVFTKQDKPQGRGMKLTPSPVKEISLTHNISCFQPESLKDGDTEQSLAALQPELIVVVAYGLFLPQTVLDLPKYGCINVHGSLLPKYRGAAPIQWAVIHGETQTGVCTMHMVRGMDAGDVILSKSVQILENDTFGMVYDKCKSVGSQVLLETIPLLAAGTAPRIPQEGTLVTFAPPIQKADARIDWNASAGEIHNLIRGMQPVPGATASTNSGDIFKLHESHLTEVTCTGAPGTVFKVDTEIYVSCGDGHALRISKIQAPGRPRMAAADYVRGHDLPNFISNTE